MSDAAKKPDVLENIKELKNFDASKLGGLGARIKTAKNDLDNTIAFVRSKIDELTELLKAEKIKTEEEAQKAAQAEASAQRAAEKAQREKTALTPPPQIESAETSEPPKTDGQKPAEKAAAAAVQEPEKAAALQESAETANETTKKAGLVKGVETERIEKTEKTEEAERTQTAEKAVDSDESEKAENREKVKSSETKKKAYEFFERQEKSETGANAEAGQADADADRRPAEARTSGQNAADSSNRPRVQQPDARQRRDGVALDPSKRAQAESNMTTSYSSGNRGGYDRPQYDNRQPRDPSRGGYAQGNQGGYAQGQRPQGAGYQGQRPQGGGYQGQGQRPPYQGQGQRPPYQGQGGYQGRPAAGGVSKLRPVAPILPVADTRNKDFAVKKKPAFADDKKTLTKKALIQKGYVVEDITLGEDDDIVSNKRYKVKRAAKKHEFIQPVAKIDSAVITSEDIDIKVLSEKVGKTATEIVKKLFLLGITKTINESIDFETAELIAGEFGIKLTLKLEKTYEEVLENFNIDEELSDETGETRPPVVTIMGHVDHGKTSLLDYIRKTQVAEGEAGGITQHIGAYTITLNQKPITFIDTPGHEAFTAMRARGAQITDIAILVVAADDGVMPQTVEAINHAKAAGVSIIVAINKIDKPSADSARIKQQISEHGLLPEEWGGDVPMIGVSAKSGEGVQSLLENILTLAEFKELRANPKRAARGTVIEAKLDKGRGPVATVLVQNGTLKIADTIVAGTAICKVRAMIDDKGKNIREAGPSIPVSVLGFDSVPEAGENMFAVADEKLAKQVIGERSSKLKHQKLKAGAKMSLEDVYNKISQGLIKDLNLIVKADVQGSVEALTQALLKISNPEVRVNIIHSGVGAVNESDIMLAGTSSSIVIAFNVRPDAKAKAAAEREDVDIKAYRIIYDAIEDIEKAMKGMLAPKYREVVLGQASVRQVFKVTGAGTIAGCMVISGKMTRSAKLRLLRDNIVIHEGSVASLKRFKEDAKEVASGFECGIGITDYNDIKEGDVIEAFETELIEVV
ncbi:MAG: translation initiation factor IF-2 [Clostridiales bacterium]|jgi:translation initiation factor IF-2|nr:translation initiation factor IF-2 [Clostridiales bacterium]